MGEGDKDSSFARPPVVHSRGCQVTLGVSGALVIEFVHDERQVHSRHVGVISPGFPQAVSAVFTSQPNRIISRTPTRQDSMISL
jgi:hypothetical protein